jgi:hypothetical protein
LVLSGAIPSHNKRGSDHEKRHHYLLNPERRAAVQRFCPEQTVHYTEQASRPEDGGAALHVFVAGDSSEVETTFCAVGPEHAVAMLMVPDEVRARLVGVVVAAGLDMNALTKDTEGAGANVVALLGR